VDQYHEPDQTKGWLRLRRRAFACQAATRRQIKVFSTKIDITHDEHDMTENISHLVLARVPGAPKGIKGIVLFVMPKFMVHEDSRLSERNDA
jgi:alkylation response protein AidB-like acyl-CoA dehydrogenase